MPMRRMNADDDFFPPSNWWHDPYIEQSVNLTGEQMQQLDELHRGEGNEIDRLERDLRVATRDVRTALEARDAVANDIITAGDRVAALRDQIFRRKISLVAHERTVLTNQQWAKLQQQLEGEMRPPMDFGGRERGGMGPRGGGRRPPG